MVIDDQLQAWQVGQAGEVADAVPIHIDYLQERHVKQHRGEVCQQVTWEPDGPQLPEALELAWQQTQGVGASVQRLKETQLTDHLRQLGEIIGLNPQGPEVLEQAQLPGEVTEFVVAQVEDAELFQGTHHLWQSLEVVEIQGQNLQVLQLAQLWRQAVEAVVAQVELNQLLEGAHMHWEAAELAPTQIHHPVQRHLPEVSGHVVLAAVSRDEGHKGSDGVPHGKPQPTNHGAAASALRPAFPLIITWGLHDKSQSLQQRKVLLIATWVSGDSQGPGGGVSHTCFLLSKPQFSLRLLLVSNWK